MTKPLLSTKLKNQITALDKGLVIELKNVRVNGEAMGCSGFVTNPRTGAVTYVSTDNQYAAGGQPMYRTATSTKDFVGGRNNFAPADDLARQVVDAANRAV